MPAADESHERVPVRAVHTGISVQVGRLPFLFIELPYSLEMGVQATQISLLDAPIP